MLLKLMKIIIDQFHLIVSIRRNLFFLLFVILFIFILNNIISKNSSQLNLFLNVKENDDQIFSPFSRTIAFIRWNSGYRERITLMDKYRPFFANLHYSIPGYTNEFSYEKDGLISVAHPYQMVSQLMDMILKQNHSVIQGLLYFHFDAWINPLRFNDMNFENIWFLDGNPPPFKCVKNETELYWWATTTGLYNTAKAAARIVKRNYSERYLINDENDFCAGWSDIYYIPRRFFDDFINLANIYYATNSFHELAIPTIVKILDYTYRSTPFHSIITRLADCWGSCCAGGARPIDIKQKRCGHRMDLANVPIQNAISELLNSETIYLNQFLRRNHK